MHSTCRKRRFKPMNHLKPEKGDVVILSEQFLKAMSFPLATVKDVIQNELQEVTDVIARKDRTVEKVNYSLTDFKEVDHADVERFSVNNESYR